MNIINMFWLMLFSSGITILDWDPKIIRNNYVKFIWPSQILKLSIIERVRLNYLKFALCVSMTSNIWVNNPDFNLIFNGGSLVIILMREYVIWLITLSLFQIMYFFQLHEMQDWLTDRVRLSATIYRNCL